MVETQWGHGLVGHGVRWWRYCGGTVGHAGTWWDVVRHDGDRVGHGGDTVRTR